jgi:ABC-type lipoprotein release transport system permease subunit
MSRDEIPLGTLHLLILKTLSGGRLLQGLPVSVRPPDIVIAAPIAALIAAVAIAACLVPARRAAVKEPIGALRSE